MTVAIEERDIKNFAEKIGFSTQELLRQSLLAFAWNRLQEVKTEILHLQKKYNIEQPEDFERLYEEGSIEEEGTWKDYQRFDHLFYQQETLEVFLKQHIS